MNEINFCRLFYISSFIFFAFMTNCTSASSQIVPDTTLGNEKSIVTDSASGLPLSLIEGGAVRGVNLFHSFEQFSVLSKHTAFFNNPLNIQNIISRVTGSSISNIDGLIQANGTANLFLLNANGIIFGPNASLNIGGSFLASTANSINFADKTQLNTKAHQTTPLLTVSVPLGLGFSGNSQGIRVQGVSHNLTSSSSGFPPITGGSSSTGLLIQSGKTLALIGGNVSLDGGILTTEGGRIELGSVEHGLVSLNPTSSGWALSYGEATSFKDIHLFQRALVDASGYDSGSIQIQGAHIKLTDGSLAWIQNRGSQSAGGLTVNGLESVEINGTSQDGRVRSAFITEAISNGDGGNIEISTKTLRLSEGAIIATGAYNTGKNGNIKLNAFDSIEIFGISPIVREGSSGIASVTYGFREGGDITAKTRSLTIEDRGNLTSYTYGFKQGGNIKVLAEYLNIAGGGGVGTLTFGDGKGGDVSVVADNSIEVTGQALDTFSQFSPSVINAAAFAGGDAGDLEIYTSKLVVRAGGRVDTATLASGDAGKLTVNASEFIEVSGTVPDSVNPSLIDSSASVVDRRLQQILRVPSKPSGKAGDVVITTRRLSVLDGGQVSVRNDGSGNAGTLQLNAKTINLDNEGAITATTTSGEGGNILFITESLQLRNNSLITATAGGNGGNITINTDTLAALEDSDISANSTNSLGGRVEITAQGVFGAEFRNELTPESDITATGAEGRPELSGTVEINTPDVDPNRGLANLPTEPVDATGLIAQGCSGTGSNVVGKGASEFIITGRGGLPRYQPGEPLRAEALLDDENRLEVRGEKPSFEVTSKPSQSTPSIVEAQGWVINAKGQVVLTAEPFSATSYSSAAKSTTTCNVLP